MVLISYLKRQWKLLLLLAGITAVFAAVFSLYGLPVEAVAYAALLCLALGAVLCGRLSLLLGGRTAAVVCVPLLLAFALMFRRENRPDPAGSQPEIGGPAEAPQKF